MVDKQQFEQELNNINNSIVDELRQQGVVNVNEYGSSILDHVNRINKCNPVLNIEYGVSSCDDTSKLCIDCIPYKLVVNSEHTKQLGITSLSDMTLLGQVTSAPQNSIIYNDKLFLFGIQMYSGGVDENACVLIYDFKTGCCDYTTMNVSTYDTISCIRKDNIAYLQFSGKVYKFNLDTYETESYVTIGSFRWYSIDSTTMQIVDDKLYILGGHSNNSVNWIQCVDLLTDTVIDITETLPYAVTDAASIYYNSNIYLFGGYNVTTSLTALNNICRYNPHTKEVEQLNINLGIKFTYCKTLLIDNKLYLFSNSDVKLYIINMDSFEIENSYELQNSITSTTLYNDKIYFTINNVIHYFDTKTQTFTYNTNLISLEFAKLTPTYILDGSNLYILSGRTTTTSTDNTSGHLVYNLEDMTINTYNISGITKHYYFSGSNTFKYNDKHYIIGGSSSNGVYELDLSTMTCKSLFALNNSCIESKCMVQKDNFIYIFGYKKYYSYSYSSGYNHYKSIIKVDLETQSYQELDGVEVPFTEMNPIIYNSELFLFSHNIIYKYNFDTNEFTETTLSFEKPLYDYGIGLIGDNVYVIGGEYNYTENNVRYQSYSKDIHIFNLSNNEHKVLENYLTKGYKYMSSVVYNDTLYLLGGCIEYDLDYYTDDLYTNHIFKLDTINALNKNCNLILSSDKNVFTLINKDNVNIDIGIEELYVGDFFGVTKNISHLAYLYKDGEWKSLKQINDEGDV